MFLNPKSPPKSRLCSHRDSPEASDQLFRWLGDNGSLILWGHTFLVPGKDLWVSGFGGLLERTEPNVGLHRTTAIFSQDNGF